MQARPTVIFLFLFLAGIQGQKLSKQAGILIEAEIDNISDSSSDIILDPERSEASAEVPNRNPYGSLFEDPKIYGMNIGLHFILEDINRRIATGNRVHLESLIKVLVLTHNIEKVGGTINDSNKLALEHAAKLYPVALREAMQS